MAFIKPFKAARPRTDMAKEVAALPYDALSTEEARLAVKNKPYSFLHIDKAEIDLSPDVDVYSDEVYEKANENFQKMLRDGIFIQEKTNCLYIYELTADGRSQTGIVACASVDDYLLGNIKKHELTREEKEQDRIRHVDTLNAQTGPIFLAYKPIEKIKKFTTEYKENNAPIYDFVTDEGSRQRAWIIDKPDDIGDLQILFADAPSLYIADGHHRNASAVKVALKRREKNPEYNGSEEFNYYLSVLFPSDELMIMDYNRVIKDLNSLSEESFFKELEERFDIEKAEGRYKPQKPREFGMYISGSWYILRAKEGLINENDVIASLDVSILQNLVISPILGITDIRTDSRIDFVGGVRGLEELERLVDGGKMKLAFAMFPTSMEQLTAVADGGKIMPPKSTWFEPKLQSGLFIHLLD